MKRMGVFIFCFVLESISVLGQDTVILPVPNIFQKGDRLCWAASMEMFLSYKGNISQNQCVIAEMIARRITNNQNIVCTPCSNSCCKGCIINKPKCNKSADSNLIIGLLKNPFAIDATSSIATWDILRTEIGIKNTPLFGMSRYNPVGSACVSSHLTLIRGYEIDNRVSSTTKDTFYLINDPFNKCNSSYSKLRYSPLPTINEICSYIYQIHPIQQPLVARMAQKSIEQINEDWIGEITEPISQNDLKKKLEKDSYLASKTIYVSTETLKSETVIELMYQKDKPPYTITTLQKIGQDWLPIEIKLTTNHFNFIVSTKQKQVLLSNYPQYCITDLQILPYAKIVFIPDYDHYYIFKDPMNNEIMFLRIEDTSDEKDKNYPISLKVIANTYKVNAYILNLKLSKLLFKKLF